MYTPLPVPLSDVGTVNVVKIIPADVTGVTNQQTVSQSTETPSGSLREPQESHKSDPKARDRKTDAESGHMDRMRAHGLSPTYWS